MKMKNFRLLLAIGFAMITAGCSSQDVPNSQTQEAVETVVTEENTSAQASEATYNFGEKAILDDYTLELQLAVTNDYPYNGKLRAQLLYEVENTSSADLRISYQDFEGYADDYLVSNASSFEGLGDLKEQRVLGGNLAPGKKLIGYIEFYVPEDFQILESRYTDRSGNHVTFVINRDQFITSN